MYLLCYYLLQFLLTQFIKSKITITAVLLVTNEKKKKTIEINTVETNVLKPELSSEYSFES